METDEKFLSCINNTGTDSINETINETWHTCVSHIENSINLDNTIKSKIKKENGSVNLDKKNEWFNQSDYERDLRANMTDEQIREREELDAYEFELQREEKARLYREMFEIIDKSRKEKVYIAKDPPEIIKSWEERKTGKNNYT